MAEKNASTRIWACMEGPMVGLFVSGGDSVDWPEYVRADVADKLVEALKAAEQQLDYGQVDAAHQIILRALASLQTGEEGK